MTDLPPLPEGFVLDTSYDPMKDILSSGFDFTNGYRTQADIARLKREGYKPAEHSKHLEGDAIDLVPGKSGKSMADVRAYANSLLAKWGGQGRVIDEGDHIHVQLAGWGQAPGTPGTPYSGMPELPEGFQVEQRGAVSKADLTTETEPKITAQPDDNNPGVQTTREFADSATYLPDGATDYADALHGAMSSRSVTDFASLTSYAQQWNAEHGTNFPLPMNDPSTTEAFKAAAKGNKFGVQPPTMQQHQIDRMKARQEANKQHDAANAGLAGAMDTVSRGAFDEASAGVEAVGDYLDGKGFDYTGNLNADREYLHGVEEQHPWIYLGGQVAGAFVDPIIPKADTVADMAKVGAIEGGVYGFNAGDGSLTDRALSAAEGAAGGTVLGPVIGKTAQAVGAGFRKVFGKGGEELPPIPEGFVPEEAAGAPLERDAADLAAQQPESAGGPQSAAMAADDGPSIASRPLDRIDVNQPTVAPGTPEQRAVAVGVEPADVTAPPLSEVAKAGNINLSKIEKPEDIDSLMRFTTDTFGGFQAERRGVQSWDATEALANDLGMTPDDLLARQTGEALNAEQTHAARGILSASAHETRGLAQAAINGSEADKAAFVKAFMLHAAITEKTSGAAAEAGRALNIYRKIAKASLADREAIQGAVKRLQDGATVEDVAAMVNSLADDPAALNRFARDAIKPALKDKLMFVWINALLSGPKTHIVNMTSNLLTALMDTPEQAVAAGIGAVRKVAGGNADRVLGSEIGPRFYGTLRGTVDALQAAKKGWAEEAGGKLDLNRQPIPGKAGDIIAIPTRLLNVEDEVFKAMARRSELAGMAVRKANAEGLKGAERSARIDQLLANPTDDMMAAAAQKALYQTFQRPLGPAMQKISNAINNVPVLKLFIPFIRTPTNLLKYAVERSPAAPLLKEVRADFMAGGAKRDLAIARMTLGTGIGTLAASLAAQGLITGNGPADPSARKALEANGWQPYSIKVGNEYISYRRLDPWATVIGTAADAYDLQSVMTEKQQQDAGAVLIGAATQNLASKTWLSGLSDLVDAITNPQMNAKSTITRLAASMATPTLVAQAAQMADPVLRDTSDPTYMGQIRKKIESRIPGLSDNVIAKRDIFGREIRDEGGPVDRLISPFDMKAYRNDPVAKAIYDSGARFSVPSRRVAGGNLPDDAYDMYQQLAGQYFYQDMNDRIGEDDWKTLDRAAQAKAIEKIKNASRKDARRDLMGLDR